MAIFFFLSMACVGALKPLSNSLCLGKVGFQSWRYPSLYACLALLAGPIALLFQHLTRRFAHAFLLVATVGFFLLSFLFFFFVLPEHHETWIYIAFYAWSGILGLLIPILGWVVSYDLYSVREAKRLFVILASGGILGGAVGSLSAALAAHSQPWLHGQVLLSLVILEIIAALLYRVVRRQINRSRFTVFPSSHKRDSGRNVSIKDLLELPYVRYMGGLVLVGALATTLIDLNYQWFCWNRYEGNPKDLTRIFALVLAALYLLSAAVNAFGTQRILKKFGLPVLLLISPFTLGSASLFVLFSPSFWPVIGIKGLGGILGSSLHRIGIEMLYAPLALRHSTLPLKSFVDLAMFKIGDSLGALLFVLLCSFLVSPARLAAVLQVTAMALWTLLALRVGKEYIRHLRSSVKEGVAAPLPAAPDERGREEDLLKVLRSSDPVKMRLAVVGMRHIKSQELKLPNPQFPYEGESLLQSGIYAVVQRQSRWLAMANSLVNNPNPEIGAAAFHLLVRHDPANQLRLLREKLSSELAPSPVYVCYLDQYVEHPGRFLKPTNVLRWCQELAPGERASMARVMGKSGDQAYLPILHQWAQQERSPVALGAIEAMGHFADPQFLDFLTGLLGFYWSRLAARKSLSYYGEGAVAYLSKILKEHGGNPKIKREIPLVLGAISSSDSRAALFSGLFQPDPVVSYRALQALNRIRETRDLSYTTDAFQAVIEFWARQYYRLVNLESMLELKNVRIRLLRRALEERKKSLIQRIFRTLELFLPRGDAHYCYRVLTEGRQELRDHAIELIETQLNSRLRAIIVPFLSESSCVKLAQAGKKIYSLADSFNESMSESLVEADPWFRCCLLSSLREIRQVSRVVLESVESCSKDFNALVRETAQWTLAGFSSPTANL
jgi:AAA family ATP:ADP antiporter